MFGWLSGSPRCPVDPEAKAWIERRLRWLRDEFGADDLYSGVTVTPTEQFFPDRFDGSRKAAFDLFDRVCEYMGVEPGVVELQLFRPAANPLFMVNESGAAVPTEAAGTYQHGLIRLNTDELANPMSLVGTLAHELAHQRLLGEGRIDPFAFDNELLTDLTVVFKGLGLFLANTPRTWDGQYSRWPDSELRKPEYMTTPMFGYALGLISWLRGEPRPGWHRHLNFGVRGEFRQAVRFLDVTSDTAFPKPVREK